MSSTLDPSEQASAASHGPQAVFLSVVIPTYNRVKLLSQCLDRLAPSCQLNAILVPAPEAAPAPTAGGDMPGCTSYEVIVSDDGTDHTTEQFIRANYPWVRWISGPRRGPAANRNNGAHAARGSWLVFTDDDCLPSPEWLSAFAESTATGVRVLEGKTTTDAENGGPFKIAPTNETGGKLWSCNFAIRKDAFEEIGKFDERFPFAHLEDVDFRLRISDRSETIQFLPQALVIHPLRQVTTAFRHALTHESYFYLAAKRKLSLREVGLSFYTFARFRFGALCTARSFGEALRYLLRSGIEVVLLIGLLPIWYLQYLAFDHSAPRPGATTRAA